MSTNVLIICEDATEDQHILRPIITAMMEAVGRPNAKVMVYQNLPKHKAISRISDWETISEIIDNNKGKTDLFLLCVDRDGKEDRRAKLDNLESEAAKAKILSPTQKFLAENAWQEVEVWALAGHDLPSEWSWAEIRREANPKETYFEPFAKRQGVSDGIAGGRKALSEEAVRRYDRIRRLCPEDVENLENRIRGWIEETGQT